MGFFSYKCVACDNPVLSVYDLAQPYGWMASATVVFPNGDRISGNHDGYGRIGGHELPSLSHKDNGKINASIFHQLCWKAEGKPNFTKKSETDPGQGYPLPEWDENPPKKPEVKNA